MAQTAKPLQLGSVEMPSIDAAHLAQFREIVWQSVVVSEAAHRRNCHNVDIARKFVAH
jgi:hypothetical protein